METSFSGENLSDLNVSELPLVLQPSGTEQPGSVSKPQCSERRPNTTRLTPFPSVPEKRGAQSRPVSVQFKVWDAAQNPPEAR